MDTLSHALYGYAALRWRGPKAARWGALFGAAPDLIYSITAYSRRLMTQGWSGMSAPRDNRIWLKDGPPLPPDLVADYNDFYRYTHSLVLLAIAAIIWYAVRRKPPWLLLPWLIHILMDIPSHERYTTQFLFPLSNFEIVGIAWSRPPMLIANAIGLFVVFSIIYWRYWRKPRAKGVGQRA